MGVKKEVMRYAQDNTDHLSNFTSNFTSNYTPTFI